MLDQNRHSRTRPNLFLRTREVIQQESVRKGISAKMLQRQKTIGSDVCQVNWVAKSSSMFDHYLLHFFTNHSSIADDVVGETTRQKLFSTRANEAVKRHSTTAKEQSRCLWSRERDLVLDIIWQRKNDPILICSGLCDTLVQSTAESTLRGTKRKTVPRCCREFSGIGFVAVDPACLKLWFGPFTLQAPIKVRNFKRHFTGPTM